VAHRDDDAGTLRARLRVPPRALLAATLRSGAFWRFALLLLLCSMVRMVLQYVTAAMPKYLTRSIGPKCEAATPQARSFLALLPARRAR
jgi:hypothetical protein